MPIERASLQNQQAEEILVELLEEFEDREGRPATASEVDALAKEAREQAK